MEKQIFKTGDRVFNFENGWGEVRSFYQKTNTYHVRFDNGKKTNIQGYRLSFTEYTLQGFSQERPINYEDYIGKWGIFYNNKCESCYVIGKLAKFFPKKGYPFSLKENVFYRRFSPLTEEQIKILGLE